MHKEYRYSLITGECLGTFNCEKTLEEYETREKPSKEMIYQYIYKKTGITPEEIGGMDREKYMDMIIDIAYGLSLKNNTKL